jgi:hypothetical protein
MSSAHVGAVDRRLTGFQRAIAAALAVATAGAAALIFGGVLARADPTDPPPDPYPRLRYFTKIDSAPYFVPGQGVWFVTAQGLNCGIWWRGSFGCTGDIPGAPPNVHTIGWNTGDTRVHYDWTMGFRFPSAQGQLTLPPLNYMEFEGTTGATTVDGGTYFERGPWRLLITPTQTWLNGPTAE